MPQQEYCADLFGWHPVHPVSPECDEDLDLESLEEHYLTGVEADRFDHDSSA